MFSTWCDRNFWTNNKTFKDKGRELLEEGKPTTKESKERKKAIAYINSSELVNELEQFVLL